MINKLVNKAVKILEKHVVVRFIISGGTSAFIDLLLLYLFNSVWGVHYLTSAVIAFIGAFGVSFTLHKFWTFKSHGDRTHKQAVLYLGTSLFGLILNTLLMYLFVDHIFTRVLLGQMKIKVILSQIIVGIIVACVSFFLSHRFVFKYKENNIEIDIT